MTVRKTTVIIAAVALAFGAVVTYAAERLVLLRSFARLEEQDTRQNVDRVRSALAGDLEGLSVEAGDYSGWDDTYAFVADPSGDYVAANLGDLTFSKLRLSFMVFVNPSGRVVYGKWFDLDRRVELPMPESLLEHLSSSRILWDHRSTEGSVAGIVVLPEGPVLLASRPILTSEYKGPIRGALIMGRLLNAQEVARLSEMTHVSIVAHAAGDPQVPGDFQAAASHLSREAPTYVHPLSSRSVAGYTLVEDIYGKPGVVLRVDLPRRIFGQGRATVLYSMGLLAGVILVLGAVATLLMGRLVVSRLERLSFGVGSIAASRNLSARVSLGGRDELAGLAGAINEMLAALEEGQDKLRESEERYRTLIENQGEGIGIVDPEGRLAFANPAAHEILGLPPGGLAGRTLYDFADAGQCSAILSEMESCPPGARTTRELGVTQPGGDRRTLLLTATPRFNGRGEFDGTLAIFRDITGQREAEEKIRHLTFHDGLTGLYNRAYFEEELKRLDTERQLPLSVVMGDVNGLKLVNDAFGHSQGDKLLVQIGRLIAGSCRHEDIVCRFGGDEFAILLPKTTERTATEVTARIRRTCEQAPDDPIRPSIALAVATKENVGQGIHEVLRQAEDRMYRNKLVEGKGARSSIVSSLQRTLGEKTHETEEHARRLQDLGLRMGRALGLPDSLLDELSLLAVLHDIGKIAVPDNILTKPGTLTQAEWDAVRKHPEVGYRIAAFSEGVAPVAEAILAHHERWDGGGYPQGLEGREIPVTSRIIAIVDAYDVMTRGRPYKEAVDGKQALEELARCAGTQFDPELVDVFVRLASVDPAANAHRSEHP